MMVHLRYRNLDPFQCALKANQMQCWLLQEKIKHEMVYDSWAEEIPIAVEFESEDDAIIFKLKWVT